MRRKWGELTGAGSRLVGSILAVALAVTPAIHGQAKRSWLVLVAAAEFRDVASAAGRGVGRRRWRHHRHQPRDDAHRRPPHFHLLSVSTIKTTNCPEIYISFPSNWTFIANSTPPDPKEFFKITFNSFQLIIWLLILQYCKASQRIPENPQSAIQCNLSYFDFICSKLITIELKLDSNIILMIIRFDWFKLMWLINELNHPIGDLLTVFCFFSDGNFEVNTWTVGVINPPSASFSSLLTN